MDSILDELRWRGLIDDCTHEDDLAQRLTSPQTLYCGFDPTADSLHVGNLVPLLALRRFQLFGHRPIAVAGGATGAIGDPSGKTAERSLMPRTRLESNLARITEQLTRLLDFETPERPALLLDNYDWTASVSFLDFLRDVGKHFSVNMMVAKESVRARMEDRESGISYTEFSYMLLQAFDFHHLYTSHDCVLQIGGSDQWGNITAGIDLNRKKSGAAVFGLTLPLLTNADGSKFGKTADGAVWLDARKTSVYRFYQFWIRTDDRDVVRHLKYFTFLTEAQIGTLDREHTLHPELRTAQKKLAWEMTSLIHGSAAAENAVAASEILFGGDLSRTAESALEFIGGEVPSVVIPEARLQPSWPLVDLLIEAKLCPSKGQARKDISNGGINLNNVRLTDPQKRVGPEDLLFRRFLLLRKGKKNYVLARFE